jgi:hypothetical protein
VTLKPLLHVPEKVFNGVIKWNCDREPDSVELFNLTPSQLHSVLDIIEGLVDLIKNRPGDLLSEATPPAYPQ